MFWKIFCVSLGQHLALPIKHYLPKYSSVNLDQLRTIFRWWAVGKCLPVLKWLALKGSKVWPGEIRLTPASAMAKAVCVSRLSGYIRAYRPSTVDSCKGMIRWRKQASIFLWRICESWIFGLVGSK
jgi:hypothetical protein